MDNIKNTKQSQGYIIFRLKEFFARAVVYAKNNILFISFLITNLVNSTLIRFYTVKNYSDISPIIADLAILLLVAGLIRFAKPRRHFIFYLIFSVFITVICIINSVYYSNYGTFSSASLLGTAGQLGDVSASVKSLLSIKHFVFIWQPIAFTLLEIYLRRNFYYDRPIKIRLRRKPAVTTLLSSLILAVIFISTLRTANYSQFVKQWNRDAVVRKYGIIVYHGNDLFQSMRTAFMPLFGFEQNKEIYTSFYTNENNSDKDKAENPYTDALKGKNIILIHGESIQSFLLGETINGVEITPNLNKLIGESLYFTNFYAQDGNGTSSDSEFTLLTSLLPSTSGTVAVNYWDRYYVSLPKLLSEKDYYCVSMHANKGEMWNRKKLHKSLGYDEFLCYDEAFTIDEIIGLGLSDKSFFSQGVEKIKDLEEKLKSEESADKNFLATMIMLSNHSPFTESAAATDFKVNIDYEVTDKDGNVIKNTFKYINNTYLGNYIKSVHYADEAIGQFIQELDDAGLLENTAIVFYGDHDAKISASYFDTYYNYNRATGKMRDKTDPDYVEINNLFYEINRKVPFFIWTKDEGLKGTVDTVMGMYDVLPTLGNLFGFSDPYALGHDILSTDENTVVFPSGNWLTNNIYYNGKEQTAYVLDDDDLVLPSPSAIEAKDFEKLINDFTEDPITTAETLPEPTLDYTAENDLITVDEEADTLPSAPAEPIEQYRDIELALGITIVADPDTEMSPEYLLESLTKYTVYADRCISVSQSIILHNLIEEVPLFPSIEAKYSEDGEGETAAAEETLPQQ